jgi:hypothetical protein
MSYIYEPCLKALHESGCNSSTAVLCRGLLLNDKTINYTTIATSTNESFHVNINGSLTIVYNGTNNSVCVELVCIPQGPPAKFNIVHPSAQESQCDLVCILNLIYDQTVIFSLLHSISD